MNAATPPAYPNGPLIFMVFHPFVFSSPATVAFPALPFAPPISTISCMQNLPFDDADFAAAAAAAASTDPPPQWIDPPRPSPPSSQTQPHPPRSHQTASHHPNPTSVVSDDHLYSIVAPSSSVLTRYHHSNPLAVYSHPSHPSHPQHQSSQQSSQLPSSIYSYSPVGATIASDPQKHLTASATIPTPPAPSPPPPPPPPAPPPAPPSMLLHQSSQSSPIAIPLSYPPSLKRKPVRSAVEEARLRAQREAESFAESRRPNRNRPRSPDRSATASASISASASTPWQSPATTCPKRARSDEGRHLSDEGEADKQQRYKRRLDMNRESAAVSRVRRRAYVKQLEERLAAVEAEKLQLEGKLDIMMSQNDSFKKQLDRLFLMVATTGSASTLHASDLEQPPAPVTSKHSSHSHARQQPKRE